MLLLAQESSMKIAAVLALMLAALVAATPAAAQGTLPIALELRGDAGVPLGDFHQRFNPGLGWGVQGNVDLTPAFTLYAGYSRAEFSVRYAGDVKARDDGFDLGGRAVLWTRGPLGTPFVQVGVLLHDETGVEAGLGTDYRIGNALGIVPLARFRKAGDAQYVALGVGLRLRP